MARVLLAKARRMRAWQEDGTAPLGPMYIAAVLRDAGHDVRIYDAVVDWTNPERFRDVLASYRPEIVGLSGITFEGPVMEGMARLCKATLPDVPVIAGGVHATSYPDRCARLGTIDYVVLGEGERTAVELVDLLARGGRDASGIPGLAFWDERASDVVFTEPRDVIEDLDSLPFPAWDLIDVRAYFSRESMSGFGRRPHMELSTSRGCPYQCIYCHRTHGKHFRGRSAQSVLDEVEILRSRYGINDFEVVDDVFNFDRGRMSAILDGMLASNTTPKIHFPNGLRGDLLDEDQIRHLRLAGTKSMGLAVETVTPRLQHLIRKEIDIDRVAESFRLAAHHGIYAVGFFMLGLPTETAEEAQATVDWALSSDVHHAYFLSTAVFGGTTMYDLYPDLVHERGLAEGDSIFRQEFARGPQNLSAMSDDELYAIQQQAFRRMMLDPRRIARILARSPSRRNVVAKALTALYLATPLGRLHERDAGEVRWSRVASDLLALRRTCA